MIGSIRLMVRPDGAKDWGELRILKYDDKSSEKAQHRDKRVEAMKDIRDAWSRNYKQLSTADFRIIEESIFLDKPRILSGPLK